MTELVAKIKSLGRPDENGCIRVFHGLSTQGYARVQIGPKRYYVHKVILEHKLGRPLKPGYESAHSCDVPNCINEDHLFEKTHMDNMKEASRKGRMKNNWPWAK